MLEIIYRIYEVMDKSLDNPTLYQYGCPEKELVMDCKLVDSREQFKSLIKEEYGNDITFRNSKNLKPGDLFCIIIGEHCYNTENYFVKIKSHCSYCNCELEGYFKPITFDNYELDRLLFGINKEQYDKEMFCSQSCKNKRLKYLQDEIDKNKDQLENANVWIDKSSFTESQTKSKIVGYIYKITKRSTGEFYIGETTYVPIFRWGQHLLTERFNINNIEDYIFEVIDTVYEGTNIFEVESKYIKEYFYKFPKLSLNISGITEEMKLDVERKSKTNKLF
jgi:hypothetical protein